MINLTRRRASFCAAVAVLLVGAAPAAGQGFDLRSLFSTPKTATPTPPQDQPPPAQTQAPREWTGEDGASGHPLMRAAAIRAAAANFRACLEGIWPLAQQRSVPRAVFDKLMAGVTPDLRIMDLLDSQPEFSKAPWEYLDVLVTDTRIADGRAILAKHRAAFDRMEKAYGVDRHVIAAIWGIEFELRHADRRPPGDPLDRDTRLHRPPAGFLPR